ncbi:hypothetical protein H257_11512 [Aphanomyces astaci]|uniref:CBM1 domain-containing protein n=1 Tax=Aphanomyces astaci TaxID=112090 RepID=W4G4G0_APHAT|nr:hypothetical protein H257_11512 [Aphanomyces astaci]ETV73848.1 hypothetical protein H257_11512 [Aphanomyces astaci]|eukprot:XP_009836784.1 hypothetical protein H257_11512 [Aphanomyces astaci]
MRSTSIGAWALALLCMSTYVHGCTNVSVEGDATYCVEGAICGDEGDACPNQGDVAAANCVSNIKSFVANGQCVAPVTATCQRIKSGARGCVFSTSPSTPTPITTLPTVPPTTEAPSGSLPSSTKTTTTAPTSATPTPIITPVNSTKSNSTGRAIETITFPPQMTTTAPELLCAEKWSQCNGQNWPNGVCCKDQGWQCVYHSDVYSQCLPN